MCLLVASTQHPNYSLIVLDNRDEFLNRPTADAHWWPGHDIYGPQDLAREEKGTWMGVSHTGRVAVLLNFHEEENYIGPISRGVLPKEFLESALPPKQWKLEVEQNPEFANCGGFTLMIGTFDVSSGQAEVEFVSNRHSNFGPLGPHDTVAVSNGAVDDPSWIKTGAAKGLLLPLLDETDPSRFIDGALRLMSTETLPPPSERAHLRKHIFVPRIELADDAYGTRTQTVITIDKHGRLEYTSVDVASQKRLVNTFVISS